MSERPARPPIDFKTHDDLWAALNAAEATISTLTVALEELCDGIEGGGGTDGNGDTFDLTRAFAALAHTQERCADCDEAGRHANSDATTPGFFYDKCSKHRAHTQEVKPE